MLEANCMDLGVSLLLKIVMKESLQFGQTRPEFIDI